MEVLPKKKAAVDCSARLTKDFVASQNIQITKASSAPTVTEIRSLEGDYRIASFKPTRRPLGQGTLDESRKTITSSTGDNPVSLVEFDTLLGRILSNSNAHRYDYQDIRDLVEVSAFANLETDSLKGKPSVALVRDKNRGR